jgi:hypothetical protein
MLRSESSGSRGDSFADRYWSPLNGFLLDFRAIGSLDGTGHTTPHYQSAIRRVHDRVYLHLSDVAVLNHDDALPDLELDQRYSLW